ncbi:hypothetical protein FB451DRAFT_1252706 [Mycena latifolia]|nr:hypothetical protein FB451DRAFT_1252706 [Mycena latifolia]
MLVAQRIILAGWWCMYVYAPVSHVRTIFYLNRSDMPRCPATAGLPILSGSLCTPSFSFRSMLGDRRIMITTKEACPLSATKLCSY